MKHRLISTNVSKDLETKIVLVSGPRQCGKTTLAKSLSKDFEYLNFDAKNHRKTLIEQSWNRNVKLVIFDELHKMKKWKSWLKGVFDSEGTSPQIIVTGSARLDIAKKMGDSLAGRHFLYRLHPLTLFELQDAENVESNFKRLMQQGGFPEPFLSEEPHFYNRWKRSHMDIILRQDLIDLENVRDISSIETLIELLKERVGSLISYQSLAEDLQVAATTVKRWLTLLENLFVIFKVTPWTRNVARSLQKASKYYFFDTGQLDENKGMRFENLIANELLSTVHYLQDTQGRDISLHFLRNKSKDEIDFAIIENKQIKMLIEAKYSDDIPSRCFKKFMNKENTSVQLFQLVAELDKEKHYPDGVKVVPASVWCSRIEATFA